MIFWPRLSPRAASLQQWAGRAHPKNLPSPLCRVGPSLPGLPGRSLTTRPCVCTVTRRYFELPGPTERVATGGGVTDQRGIQLTPDHSRAVTNRLVEVLCLLANGLTSQAAAQRLMISEHTVIRHISNMMSCFGAENRMELLALAIVCGIVDGTHWPPRPTGRLVLETLGSLRSPPDKPASECGRMPPSA